MYVSSNSILCLLFGYIDKHMTISDLFNRITKMYVEQFNKNFLYEFIILFKIHTKFTFYLIHHSFKYNTFELVLHTNKFFNLI